MTPDQKHDCCDYASQPNAKVEFSLPGETGVLTLRIDNMDCPTEEALIRNKLSGMNGIVILDFNLMQRKLMVTHTLNQIDTIQQALIAIDMHAVLIETASGQGQHADAPT